MGIIHTINTRRRERREREDDLAGRTNVPDAPMYMAPR